MVDFLPLTLTLSPMGRGIFQRFIISEALLPFGEKVRMRGRLND
jgi:hypothetical protein